MDMTQSWTRENFAHLETLFHNANGYLGVRAAPEEGEAEGVDSIRGTYLNAFYEIKDVRYGEKLYGFPETQQVMVNVPDTQTLSLMAEGERFSMFNSNVLDRVQKLDMDKGTTSHRCLWRTAHGDLRVEVRRMTSFLHKGLFLMRYCITSEGFEGSLTLTAALNADVRNHAAANDPRVAAEPLRCLNVDMLGWQGDTGYVNAKTLRSGLTLSCCVTHRCQWMPTRTNTATLAEAVFTGTLGKGESVELTQFAYYADSRRETNPMKAAFRGLSECCTLGADKLETEQREYLQNFWRDSRVVILGNEQLQQALDYDIFELLQSSGTDGISNVAAKGLSGEGYEGHTFWDSEIYVMPLFLWTQPDMARQMLLYRCSLLEHARANARSLGFAKGALYPWRTISGDECSAYFPAGTAQYHIDGDISYAFLQYWDATGDVAFMAAHGAEVLVETARFWLELGHMGEGGFRMECVTGPDEYTCLVDNNFYTNATAQYNLRGAVRVLRHLAHQKLDAQVRKATGITDDELLAFEQAAEHMYFPKDEKMGVSPQDDSFLKKKPLDLSMIPKENFPLLLHYHPLFLYRHQVCKQADTVLAHLLFPYTADDVTIRRSYAFYDGVTTHDSSLSQCVFAMMAARLGLIEQAEKLFTETVDLDRSDTHGNTRDGLHTANMGGSYLCILLGFAGLRLKEGGLTLTPVLPQGWKGYAFVLHYQGCRFRCEVEANEVKLTWLSGANAHVQLNGRQHRLSEQQESCSSILRMDNQT